MKRNWVTGLTLTALIGVSLLSLARRHDTPMLEIFGIMIGVLLFFTILIQGLLRRGARSAPELMARTLTFWWMLAGFAVAIATHRAVIFALIGVLCALALHEYFSYIEKWKPVEGGSSYREHALPIGAGFASLALCLVFAYRWKFDLFFLTVPAVAVLLLPMIFVLKDRTEDSVRLLGFFSVGTLFFVFGLGHAFLLVDLGVMALVFAFFLTEIRDLISYWVGKGVAVAYRKLPGNFILKLLNVKIAESVSPNKTWGVGLLAGLVLVGISVALAPMLPVMPRGKPSPAFAALLGAAIAFCGLMGDLVFSMIKRDLGLKDSGTLMPGRTGVIDRVDSLVFTLPVVFHLLYWHYF